MLNEILHYIFLSIAGSVALVIMSKVILNKLIRRNVNYYEDIEISEERELLQNASLEIAHLERRGDDAKEISPRSHYNSYRCAYSHSAL